MTPRRLVLWRHGETDYNAAGRMQGHLDSALTPVGWNQARFAAPALARFSPDLVIASDLHRATDTATVLTEALGVPLRIDKRLRETHLGEWQGLTGEHHRAASRGSTSRTGRRRSCSIWPTRTRNRPRPCCSRRTAA
jgi:broad specificity phosphatase PhoE